MTGLMRANFPLRLVGKVVSANDARVATGRGGTDAHLLSGRGDFLAVGGGESEPLRFQVAHVGEEGVRNEVRKLQQAMPSALAKPQSMVIDAEQTVRR
jgi:DNA segregation ATPase FtsK/SpoIIIE-like protein